LSWDVFFTRLSSGYRCWLQHRVFRLATLLGTAAFLLDWATKSWALRSLHGSVHPLGALTLFVARNEAFAFSARHGELMTWLVVSVRVAMILLIVLLCRQLAQQLSRRSACGAALLLAGGLGNSADLLFRGGAVVDFIGAGPFTFHLAGGEAVRMHLVFNAADIFILLGIALLAPAIQQLSRAIQRNLAAWERRILTGGRNPTL
jgi:lipoprotein signal peptidase